MVPFIHIPDTRNIYSISEDHKEYVRNYNILFDTLLINEKFFKYMSETEVIYKLVDSLAKTTCFLLGDKILEIVKKSIVYKNTNLINHVFKKINEVDIKFTHIFGNYNILYELYINNLKFKIKLEADAIHSLYMYDLDFQKYIVQLIEINDDNLPFLMIHHEDILLQHKIEKIDNIFSYAHRYNSKCLQYLYQRDKPIKSYVSENLLISEGIDPDDVTIIDDCVIEGNLILIKKFYENCVDVIGMNKRILIFLAVKYYHVDVIIYLIEQGCKIDENTCDYVGYFGMCDIMELIIKRGVSIKNKTIYFTAKGGGINLMKMYKNNGIIFDPDTFYYINKKDIEEFYFIPDILKKAIQYDIDEDIIERLYEKNANIDNNIMAEISNKGNYRLLRYFMSKGLKVDQHIIGNLITNGHYNVVKRLYDNLVPVISLSGVLNGKKITKYFDSNKNQIDDITILKGFKYNTFKLIDSFMIINCTDNLLCSSGNESIKIECSVYNQLPPVDEGAIQTAARHGYVDMVLFLIKNDAPIDDDAMYDSIVRGYTKITKILYEKTKRVNKNHIKLGKMYNRTEILKYFENKEICDNEVGEMNYSLVKNEEKWFEYGELRKDNKTDLMYVSVFYGYFENVKKLTEENIIYKNNAVYVETAVRLGRMKIFKYLISKDFAVNEKSIERAIIKKRYEYVDKLLELTSLPENYEDLCKKHNFDIKKIELSRMKLKIKN